MIYERCIRQCKLVTKNAVMNTATFITKNTLMQYGTDLANSIDLNRTQSNSIEPNRTQSNPIELNRTQSNVQLVSMGPIFL